MAFGMLAGPLLAGGLTKLLAGAGGAAAAAAPAAAAIGGTTAAGIGGNAALDAMSKGIPAATGLGPATTGVQNLFSGFAPTAGPTLANAAAKGLGPLPAAPTGGGFNLSKFLGNVGKVAVPTSIMGGTLLGSLGNQSRNPAFRRFAGAAAGPLTLGGMMMGMPQNYGITRNPLANTG